MIARLFYLIAGAAAGGYVVHKLNRTARAWSPGGIAHRVEGHVTGYRAAIREFGEDVQGAMGEREAELRDHYGSDATVESILGSGAGNRSTNHNLKDGR